MFSPNIVASDAFLEMPVSSRELYFQLGMHADDDGFVGPRKIMRMVGATDDDLKLLIVKKFIIPFESGVIVVRHWRVNNLIRKDWYRKTIHQEEMSLLKVAQNMPYFLVNETVPSSLTQVTNKVSNYKALKGTENTDSKPVTPASMDKHFDAGRKILAGETKKPL